VFLIYSSLRLNFGFKNFVDDVECLIIFFGWGFFMWDEIQGFINNGKLTEAMEKLKLVLSEDVVDKKAIELLNQVITKALEKNEITFALNAATYRIPVVYAGVVITPDSASWNTVLTKAHELNEFSKIDIPTQFLTPFDEYFSLEKEAYQYNVPAHLDKLIKEIWQLSQKQQWKIPGFTIKFHGYGDAGNSRILAHKVEKIVGKDFIIGFTGNQGTLPGKKDLCNTAGFSYIVAPNFSIQFYTENTTPSMYEYDGENWEEQISKISESYYIGMDEQSGWTNMKGDYFGRTTADYQIERELIANKKVELPNTAVKFLSEIVLPRLQAAIAKGQEHKEEVVKIAPVATSHYQSKAIHSPTHFKPANAQAQKPDAPEEAKNHSFCCTIS
jgi:hypothetical protein